MSRRPFQNSRLHQCFAAHFTRCAGIATAVALLAAASTTGCDRGSSSSQTRLSGGLLYVNDTVVHSTHSGDISALLKEPAERVDRRGLARQPAVIQLSLPIGNITIRSAEGEEPRLVGHWKIRAPSKEQAESVLNAFALHVDATPNATIIKSTGDPVTVASGSDEARISPSLNLELLVPPGYRIDARSNFGKLSATGPFIELALTANTGAISVADVTAPLISATGNIGDVDVSRCGGNSISATTQFGSVAIASSTGIITGRVQTGGVSIKECRFASSAATAPAGEGGSPANVIAFAKAGKIAIENCDGIISTQCDTGDISVAGLLNGLQAVTQAGSIRVTAHAGSELQSPLVATCSTGDIRVTMPATLQGMLRAVAEIGDIHLVGAFPARPVKSVTGATLTAALGTLSTKIAISTRAGSITLTRQ